MSAAKMLADSTQGDLDEPKKKRKKKKESVKRKSKKTRRERESKKSKRVLKEDDDSDLDLERDMHSLGDYIRERHEMNEQMFHCLRGPSLQRYIPDVLKELSLVELKRRCLEHLEVMSKKRIRGILSGDDPSTISSSGTEEESSDEDIPDQEQVCPIEEEQQGGDDEDGEELMSEDEIAEEASGEDRRGDDSSMIGESGSEEGEIGGHEDSEEAESISEEESNKSETESEEGEISSDEELEDDMEGDNQVHVQGGDNEKAERDDNIGYKIKGKDENQAGVDDEEVVKDILTESDVQGYRMRDNPMDGKTKEKRACRGSEQERDGTHVQETTNRKGATTVQDNERGQGIKTYEIRRKILDTDRHEMNAAEAGHLQAGKDKEGLDQVELDNNRSQIDRVDGWSQPKVTSSEINEVRSQYNFEIVQSERCQSQGQTVSVDVPVEAVEVENTVDLEMDKFQGQSGYIIERTQSHDKPRHHKELEVVNRAPRLESISQDFIDPNKREENQHSESRVMSSDQHSDISTTKKRKSDSNKPTDIVSKDDSSDKVKRKTRSQRVVNTKDNIGSMVDVKYEKSGLYRGKHKLETTDDVTNIDNEAGGESSGTGDKNVICVSDDSDRDLIGDGSEHAIDNHDVISLEDEDISVLDHPHYEISMKQEVTHSMENKPEKEKTKLDVPSKKRKSSEMSEDLEITWNKRKSFDEETANQSVKSDTRKVELDEEREITTSVKRNVIISKNTLKVVKTMSEVSSTQSVAPKLSIQERLGNKVSSVLPNTGSQKLLPDSKGKTASSASSLSKSRKVSVDASSNVTTVSGSKITIEDSKSSTSKSSSSPPPLLKTNMSMVTKPSSKSSTCSSVLVTTVSKRSSELSKSVKSSSALSSVETKTVSNKPPGETRMISIKPSASKNTTAHVQASSSKPLTSSSSSKKKSSNIPQSSSSTSTSSTTKSMTNESLQGVESSSQTLPKPGEQTSLSKNQMELLELEMRARAIKSMLAAHENKDTKAKQK